MTKTTFILITFFSLITTSLYGATDCPDGETVSSVEQQIYSQSGTVPAQSSHQLFTEYKACLDKEKKVEANRKFAGLNWGVGLAFTGINKKSIDEVEIIGGVVRTKETHKNAATLMLETHFLIPKEIGGVPAGHGPFAAIRLADSEGNDIGAYGIGYMVGFKSDPKDFTKSWNIGFGYFVDTEVKQFGSGISEGQPLPNSESTPRLIDSDGSGWIIMLSSTFY